MKWGSHIAPSKMTWILIYLMFQDDPMDGTRANIDKVLHKRIQIELDRNKARTIIRKNSISLLDPEGTIPSLMDLTQQDYEVNAPVHNLLLGQDLLSALELANGTI